MHPAHGRSEEKLSNLCDNKKKSWIHLITRFFYKLHFYKQRQTEIAKKNQANAKQHPEVEL